MLTNRGTHPIRIPSDSVRILLVDNAIPLAEHSRQFVSIRGQISSFRVYPRSSVVVFPSAVSLRFDSRF
jgi:hypothetical protein